MSNSDKSEKKNNNSSETVPLAQYEVMKWKYETLVTEHETLIKTLEVLEKVNGFTVADLAKKQREEIVAKEAVENWENKFGELQKNVEKVEKHIEELMSFDETVMNGVDSGIESLAENLHVNNNMEADKDVIVISEDDEENGRESVDRQPVNSSHQNSEFSFFL